MAAYLEREKIVWMSFLGSLEQFGERISISILHTTLNGQTLATALDKLEASLGDDPTKFGLGDRNRLQIQAVAPPPSETTEGRLIIGLHESQRTEDALAAYISYVVLELGGSGNVRLGPNETKVLNDRGNLLLVAAHAATALPVLKLQTSGIRSIKREAEETLETLKEEIGNATALNEVHEQNLAASIAENDKERSNLITRARRLVAFSMRSERRKAGRFNNWLNDTDKKVADRFADAERRLDIIDKSITRDNLRREKEFEDLRQLFHTQLRLRAPVALWEGRARDHDTKAGCAQIAFWAAAFLSVSFGILVPFFFGDYIANSFSKQNCLPYAQQLCVTTFSAKGPLTIGGLLLTSSVLLWVVRMQYRIFLSERHLSLDASEKKAFAETFMAMRQDASVDVANETIVLTSLFRPTQDGIIKDEAGSGLDFSAAALLAKQMSRP